MVLDRRGILLGMAASLTASAARAQPDGLGREWFVHEEMPDGRFWEGVWHRRGRSNRFDAEWRDSLSGGMVYDVIEVVSFDGERIRLYRRGNHGTYFGEVSESGRHLRGSTSWYPRGGFWTARIRD